MAIEQVVTVIKTIIDLIVRFVGYKKSQQEQKHSENLVGRFLRVHREHDVLPIQIPRVLELEGQLQPNEVLNQKLLLPRLNNEILNKTCILYGVRREWLDGEPISPYPSLFFYRNPRALIDFLAEISKKHKTLRLWCFKPNNVPIKRVSGNDLYIVICADSIILGERIIERFYPLDSDWPWDHQPARLDFKTMVYVCWQFGIHPLGREAPRAELQAVRNGVKFPSSLNCYRNSRHWYPDDYIFTDRESPVAKDSNEAELIVERLKENGLLALLPSQTQKNPFA